MKEMEQFRFRFNGRYLKATGLLKIAVKNLKLGSPLFFRVSDQIPKEELEVKSGYDHSFTHVSNKPFEGSIKLRISWVSWNNNVVLLIRRYETDEKKLYQQLKDFCSFEEFKDKIEKLKELPDDWNPSTRENRNHPIGFIESLVNRLEIVEKLRSKEVLRFPELANSGLALFIICTCIESLGSKHPYLSYYDWITSRKTEKEVDGAIKKISSNITSKVLLVKVFEKYNRLYGNNKSYKAFFNSLENKWIDRLEGAFSFSRNEPPTFELKESNTLDSLLDFLVGFRNAFAHRLDCHYSLPTEIEWKNFQDKRKTPNREAYAQITFGTYQRIFPSGAFETITTRNLLGTLTEAVQFSLWKWICEQSKNTEN